MTDAADPIAADPIVCIAGSVQVDPAHADAFFESCQTMMAETQKEEGCMVYDMTRSLTNPAKLHVYEEWETPAHVGAHSTSEHMKVWLDQISGMGVNNRSIRMFEGSRFIPI